MVSGNFDSYVTPGTCDYGGSGAVHAPTTYGGKLRVKTGYYVTQEFIASTSIFFRIKVESGWTAWKTTITTSDLSGITIKVTDGEGTAMCPTPNAT